MFSFHIGTCAYKNGRAVIATILPEQYIIYLPLSRPQIAQ